MDDSEPDWLEIGLGWSLNERIRNPSNWSRSTPGPI
jgi:hypothetical protein